MQQSNAVLPDPATYQVIGAYFGIVGAIIMALAVIAFLITAIFAYATRPEPLLQQPTPPAQQPDVVVELPQQQVNRTVHLNVRHHDAQPAYSLLKAAAHQWGGNLIRPATLTPGNVYAVPESAARWLESLDQRHGRDQYAKLNNVPHASVTPDNQLTAVNVIITESIIRRQSISNAMWNTAYVFAAAFIVFVVGTSIAIYPNEHNS